MSLHWTSIGKVLSLTIHCTKHSTTISWFYLVSGVILTFVLSCHLHTNDFFKWWCTSMLSSLVTRKMKHIIISIPCYYNTSIRPPKSGLEYFGPPFVANISYDKHTGTCLQIQFPSKDLMEITRKIHHTWSNSTRRKTDPMALQMCLRKHIL